MESVIREGALRLLTAEATCDVILSCQGHRLMAHKLILSMASPVFRGLLLEDCSDPTVVIFPDINGSIMSLLLDYIYTGSVVVYSNTIQDFIGVAGLLKIHLDIEHPDGLPPVKSRIFRKSIEAEKCQFDENIVKKKEEKVENLEVVSSSDPEVYSKKNQRKLPNLVPIATLQTQEKLRSPRKLCSYVLPSPWCPRVQRIFGDPRNDYLETQENQISPSRTSKAEQNDSNNNFQLQPDHTIARYRVSNNFNNRPSQYQNPKDKLSSSFRGDSSAFGKFSFEPYTSRNPSIVNNVSKKSDNCFGGKQTNNGRRTSQDDSTTPINSTNSFQLHPESLVKTPTIRDAEENDAPPTIPAPPSENIADIIKDNNSIHSSSSNDEEADKTCEDGKLEAKDEKQKPFRCKDCGKSFSQLRNYKYHRSVHEGTKEFAAKCPECGKVFNDRGYLSSHLKIHRDKKEYACPHCPKRFNQRVAYNMHLRIHTGIKPHECSICGKSFSRKMLLKQHQRVHTGERPYSCPECGKSFADRSNMSLHARLHTGVKPYACNLCPKSFTKKHHLKTHMNFHTGLKPYTCEKCGLAFSQSSNMRTHYKKCILKSIPPTNTASDDQRDSS